MLRIVKIKLVKLVTTCKQFLNDDKTWLTEFSLAMQKYSDQDYVALCHGDWLGVRSSTVELFDNVVNIKEAYTNKAISKISKLIIQSNIKQFILNGKPYGWEKVIFNIRQINPEIKFKILWHGSITQFCESTNNYLIKCIELYQHGYIDAIGFVKYSSYQFYQAIGVNCFFIANRVEIECPIKIVKSLSSPRKVGIFIAGMNFRKNVFNQYAASRLIHNAHLTISPSDSYVEYVLKHFNINATRINKPMPRDELFELIKEMDLVLYVTLSECAPMLPLECLELGVPCLIGANNHYFSNFPELYKFLVVEEMDNPVKIAEQAEVVLQNKQEIINLYQIFRNYNNKLSRNTVDKFLN